MTPIVDDIRPVTAHMNAGNMTVRVPAFVLGGPQTKWLVGSERSVYDPRRVTVAVFYRASCSGPLA